MVSSRFSHWVIQDVVIDQAKADKFLIQALELVLLKMEMVLSDTIFGAIQMFDLTCEEAMSLFTSTMN